MAPRETKYNSELLTYNSFEISAHQGPLTRLNNFVKRTFHKHVQEPDFVRFSVINNEEIKVSTRIGGDLSAGAIVDQTIVQDANQLMKEAHLDGKQISAVGASILQFISSGNEYVESPAKKQREYWVVRQTGSQGAKEIYSVNDPEVSSDLVFTGHETMLSTISAGKKLPELVLNVPQHDEIIVRRDDIDQELKDILAGKKARRPLFPIEEKATVQLKSEQKDYNRSTMYQVVLVDQSEDELLLKLDANDARVVAAALIDLTFPDEDFATTEHNLLLK